MTPLERAESLERWDAYIRDKKELSPEDIRNIRMALRGAALDLRCIHRHDITKRENNERRLQDSSRDSDANGTAAVADAGSSESDRGLRDHSAE